MNKNVVGKFMKVSRENFCKAFGNSEYMFGESDVNVLYDNLKLPRRATKFSAGYDFFLPCNIHIDSGNMVTIPTGIRVKMDENWVLMCFPRSGLGFKYNVSLSNTVGIIDSDYFMSDNEGHIFLKIKNGGNKILDLKQGDAFAQGIFLPYGVTEDDEVDVIRNGGIGSTSK